MEKEQQVPTSNSTSSMSVDTSSRGGQQQDMFHPPQPSRSMEVPQRTMSSMEPAISRPSLFTGIERRALELPSVEPATPASPSKPKIPNFHQSTVQTLRRLGEGTYGLVYLVKVPRLGIVVLKTKKRNFGLSPEQIFREGRELVLSLMLNHHPNIVAFYGEVHNGDEANPTGFLMEHMAGGSLRQYMTQHIGESPSHPLFPQLQNGWCYQIALGLAYMHSRKIVHRDLNPNNILIGNPYSLIKITDFGLSKELNDEGKSFSYTRGLGTGFYKAPEIMLDNDYGLPVDVYSYGMTVYYIFSKMAPFDGDSTMQKSSAFMVQTKLLGMHGEQPVRPALGYGAIDEVIKSCWSSYPSNRPTMDEVVTELETEIAGTGPDGKGKKYPTTEDM